MILVQHVRNTQAATSFLMVGAIAIFVFWLVLSASIFWSTMNTLLAIGRADDIHREHGSTLYYLLWKELRDHIDKLQQTNSK